MRLCSLDREHAYVRVEQKRTQKPPQQDSPHSLLSFFPDFLLVLSPFSTLLSISSSFPSFCIHTWFCHWHVLICVSVIYIYIFFVQLVLVLYVSSFFECGLIVSYFLFLLREFTLPDSCSRVLHTFCIQYKSIEEFFSMNS